MKKNLKTTTQTAWQVFQSLKIIHNWFKSKDKRVDWKKGVEKRERWELGDANTSHHAEQRRVFSTGHMWIPQ